MQNKRFDEGDCLEKLFTCEVAAIGTALCLDDEQCLFFLFRSVWACVSLDVVVGRIEGVYFHVSL